MRDRSRKYLQKSDNDCLHLGNLIAWIIQEKHIKKKDVAQHLNVLPTTLNQYFKQPSLQVGILWRLSQALNYNLLLDVGQRLEIPFETNAETFDAARMKLASSKDIMRQFLKNQGLNTVHLESKK